MLVEELKLLLITSCPYTSISYLQHKAEQPTLSCNFLLSQSSRRMIKHSKSQKLRTVDLFQHAATKRSDCNPTVLDETNQTSRAPASAVSDVGSETSEHCEQACGRQDQQQTWPTQTDP